MSPLLLALVIVAQTPVYVWTDKDGVEHFTDDLASVPQGVKVRTTEGAAISRIEPDTAKPARPVVSATTEPSFPSASEQGWRQLFRDARTRVRVLEEDIEADRKKVEEVSGLPLTAQFNCATGYYPQPVVVGGTTSVVIGGQPIPGVTVSGSVVHPVRSPQGALPPLYYPAPCFYGFNPEFERVRERLDQNRRELVRAKEELADLERRASFEAVPLHWRR